MDFRWLGVQHRKPDQHHNQPSCDLKDSTANAEEPQEVIPKPGC
ncbi:hypothetical protein SynA1825c_01076 [Synechococcus sp. A18-25c]|nr:hypothetical protein SynA1825c_01076 [Synechococcus sp. A18-25c]